MALTDNIDTRKRNFSWVHDFNRCSTEVRTRLFSEYRERYAISGVNGHNVSIQ